jgi:hypothetical protein
MKDSKIVAGLKLAVQIVICICLLFVLYRVIVAEFYLRVSGRMK